MSTRIPHSINAEENLLSCCCVDGPDVVSRCLAAGITAESFFDARHGVVFGLMVDLVSRGIPPEPAILAETLSSRNQLDALGGFPFILAVSKLVPTTAGAEFFIQRVKALETARRLIAASGSIDESARQFTDSDIDSVVNDATAQIVALANKRSDETWKHAIEAAEIYVASRIDAERHGKDADALSFPWRHMDAVFGQMRMGQVVVVAARTSIGKSSFARQIAYHAAFSGNQVVFVSIEVGARSLALNLAQTISGIAARDLAPISNARDVADFRAALARVNVPAFDIVASSAASLAGIQARAEVLRAKGRPPRLVVVDYLQLLADCAPSKGENRASSIGRVSRALKAFAMAQNCVVLLLSQLNRDSEKEGREPALHDLRESGDIEQDADKVILLHRPADNPITGIPQPGTSLPSEVPSFHINAIQAKGRDDGTGVVELNFKRAITRFTEIDRTHANQ